MGVVLGSRMIPAQLGAEELEAGLRLLVMPNHRKQKCPLVGGQAVTAGIVEVTRGNKDSGIDVRFRGHLQWGREWGMASPPQARVWS